MIFRISFIYLLNWIPYLIIQLPVTVFTEKDTQHVFTRYVHFPNEHMQMQGFPESRMRFP